MAGVESLVLRMLYSLDEPWRSRFLILTAQLATGWQWDGREPEWAEVEAWLSDCALQRSLRALLYIWTGGGTRCLTDTDSSLRFS